MVSNNLLDIPKNSSEIGNNLGNSLSNALTNGLLNGNEKSKG